MNDLTLHEDKAPRPELCKYWTRDVNPYSRGVGSKWRDCDRLDQCFIYNKREATATGNN
jgi:hypothetical protein